MRADTHHRQHDGGNSLTNNAPSLADRTLRAPGPGPVYLVAPGGHPNYGDEFILRAWLRYLAAERPDTEVVVDCHTPGQAAVLLSRWHPRVTFVDTIWRICFETSELPVDEAAAVAADTLANPGRMPRLVSGVDLLSRADTVHLVGGGYVNTVWPHHLAIVAAAAESARRFGVRAVATGQGLVPAGDADRVALLRESCREFALFDVRDQPSLEVLADPGIHSSFSGDDAWLGVGEQHVYDRESPAARRDVIFCLQSDLMEDFDGGRGLDGLTDAVLRVIDDWRLAGPEVAFVEGLPGADRHVYDRVRHAVPDALFVPFTEVWQRGLPARSGQTWVSTRFHPHLIAAAAGANGLALTGHGDYYPVKHESLTQAGSRWLISDADALPATPPTEGGFPAEAVAARQHAKRSLARRLYPPDRSPVRRAARRIRRLTRRG